MTQIIQYFEGWLQINFPTIVERERERIEQEKSLQIKIDDSAFTLKLFSINQKFQNFGPIGGKDPSRKSQNKIECAFILDTDFGPLEGSKTTAPMVV